MDLNASPLPEDDEEYAEAEENEHHNPQPVEEREAEYYEAGEERAESGVETLRREREERRQRLKRERHDDDDRGRFVKQQRLDIRPSDKSKHLPEGWLDCPSVGQALFNIIPSKVPLGEDFNDYIAPGKRYSSKQVVRQQRVLSRDVGMVIDLTNTWRYYKVSEWKRDGIKHIKIPCKGRDAVPDNASVNNFVYEVSHFLHQNKQKKQNKHVLVHCTHGFNRTGFMIVHYLVRTQGMSVKEAMEKFAAARPPGIYKPDYIDALFKLYNERKPESAICPPTPEWKRSVVDLNGNGVDDDDDDGDGDIMAALQDVEVENGVMTNDDVLGDEIPIGLQTDMQKICCTALGVKPNGNYFFPGSQPVSLDRAHLQLLRQRYYYATWKADGTRYMMLITREGCYLIDRKFTFRRVQLRFPKRGLQQGCFESHHFTLLDGEMIIDTVPETGEQKRRYLVYDLIMVNGHSKIKLPFHERWKLIEREIIEPRAIDNRTPTNRYYVYDMEPFRVRRKAFWMLSAVSKVLKDFIPKLSHEADGLIFQGWDDPYVPRTHDGLLKWKYAHMNSVDFLFEVGEGDRRSIYLMEKGKNRKLEGAHVTFPDDQVPSNFHGKIIECSWSPNEQCWEFMRVRTDKPTPNGWHTYMKVMRSINDNISEDDVLTEIAEIIRLPMYAERIKHETQAMQQHAQATQAARRR